MKKVILFVVISLFTLVQLNLLYSQGSDEKKQQENWKWVLLDDFEDCHNWEIINSSFSTEKWKFNEPCLSRVKGSPKEIATPNNQYCLGAKFHMDETGDTRKFIKPRHIIVLPGYCSKISFWVNGRDKGVVMSVMFLDENNILYTFKTKPAVLDFYGWKKLEVDNLDKKLDQFSKESRHKGPMKIIAFIFENPLERIFDKEIYVYIDQLEAYCRDDQPGQFDGSEIKDIW